MAENLDKIHIRDLFLRCIIGLYDWEREKKQDIFINIILYADLSKAGETDDINDTADYKAIKKKVVEMVESSSFKLLERLAQEIADVCLEHAKIEKVNVMIDKTGALRFAKSVAVEITRAKNETR